jgi:polysaccharide deacetylase 2 family uncharacterized protein YibQ
MTSFAAAPAPAYVAIIIDNIGNNLKSGGRAVSLPLSLTYAMLPHSPFAASLAQKRQILTTPEPSTE